MTLDPTKTVVGIFAVSGLGLLLDIVGVAIPQWTVVKSESDFIPNANIGLWGTLTAGGCQHCCGHLRCVRSGTAFEHCCRCHTAVEGCSGAVSIGRQIRPL